MKAVLKQLSIITGILLLSGSCFPQNTDPDPRFGNFHFGTTDHPLDHLTLTWSNTGGTGDKLKWGFTALYEMGIFTYPNDIDRHPNYENQGPGYLYDYTFPVLPENQIVYYKVFDSRNNKWGDNKTFTTSGNGSGGFSFVATGDSQSGIWSWQEIAAAISNESVDFALYLGDHVDGGNNGQEWEEWYEKGIPFLESATAYHAYGNHNGSAYNHSRQFVLPENPSGSELYYSFTFGNALFVCLDSEHPEDTTQYSWLINTLNTFQDFRWKVVYFHKPFYSCGGHAGEMDNYFNTWWKAFDDFGVDLIFNGHAHNYQRSQPINRNIDASAPVSVYGSGPDQGRCQIVTGGAGAPLYPVDPSPWFVTANSVHHYCLIEVNGDSLLLQAKNTDGVVFDELQLCKPNIFNLRVFLEGPFDGQKMHTMLNPQLPLSQPYNSDTNAIWYHPQDVAVTNIPNTGIVDWILVEFRETTGDVSTAIEDSAVMTQPAFLLKNGHIVDLDGESLPEFHYEIKNNLHAVIMHRNHLGIISSFPLTLQNGIYSYDFTTGSSKAYGGNLAQNELAPGVWGMISGDGNANGQINISDKNDVWMPQASYSGYLMGDFNMDAHVNNTDKNAFWAPNNGSGGQVP